jgi:hypothetical protein
MLVGFGKLQVVGKGKTSSSVVAVVGSLILSPIASTAQTTSPNPPEPKCDLRTGNLLEFDYLIKPDATTGLPNFNLAVKGKQGEPYDYTVIPLSMEDKLTLISRQESVESIIDTAIEVAKNYCQAKVAKEGQETFRPYQTPAFASRIKYSPAA